MNRQGFEKLRDSPDKTISADIVFEKKKETVPDLVFEQIRVENSLGMDIVLNGTYKPSIPAVTFNFVLRGVGPICRLCVNGTIHKDVGRTHKHELIREDDPRLNLPTAVARPDLAGKSVKETWEILCQQANIIHTGKFKDPEGGAS